jgi:hypothetical protein
MRNGFDSLAARAQTVLRQDPFSDHVFCFSWPPWRCGQAVWLREGSPKRLGGIFLWDAAGWSPKASPICYPHDVSDGMVADWRRKHP